MQSKNKRIIFGGYQAALQSVECLIWDPRDLFFPLIHVVNDDHAIDHTWADSPGISHPRHATLAIKIVCEMSELSSLTPDLA